MDAEYQEKKKNELKRIFDNFNEHLLDWIRDYHVEWGDKAVKNMNEANQIIWHLLQNHHHPEIMINKEDMEKNEGKWKLETWHDEWGNLFVKAV